MKYGEVKLLATQHPFRIDPGCRNLILMKGGKACGIGSTYKYLYGDDIERTEEANANAALMVHCKNKFDGILDGLREAFQEACKDNKDQAWIDRLDALIVDAEEVEGI